MKSNLLHINLEKCCYVHFRPRTRDFNQKEDNDYNADNLILDIKNTLNILGTAIPEDSHTKFLCVTVDSKLSWIPHIDQLHKMLKSATRMLYVPISQKFTINLYTMHYSRAIYQTA